MRLRRIECHPHVAENAGRNALMCGPILYCVEQVDNPAFDLDDIVLPSRLDSTFVPRSDVLGGIYELNFKAAVHPVARAWDGSLYRAAAEDEPGEHQDVQISAIPYYAWANRKPGAMRVWLKAR
jgi:DUF1680 family protein